MDYYHSVLASVNVKGFLYQNEFARKEKIGMEQAKNKRQPSFSGSIFLLNRMNKLYGN